jgi:GNAT superfamily N-acetyltransferase
VDVRALSDGTHDDRGTIVGEMHPAVAAAADVTEVADVTPLDGIRIRRATEGDLAAIVALLADDVLGSVREDLQSADDPIYVRAFRRIDADPAHLLVVAERDGQVVGTLQLTFLPSLTHRGGVRAHVEGVRVAAGLRGSGLGAHLLRWVEERAREHGARMVQLMTDVRREDARRFYERLGYVASHHGMKLFLDDPSDPTDPSAPRNETAR